jgi:peptide/nickel transport system substrate-binding protein
MTSADVVASFDRYGKVGLQRSTLDNVDRWDAPDKYTFVIHMKKVQPTFIERCRRSACPSSSSRPRTRTTRRSS